eukprot:1160494-Pelagomonas_calceolata.AAC.14
MEACQRRVRMHSAGMARKRTERCVMLIRLLRQLQCVGEQGQPQCRGMSRGGMPAQRLDK